MKRDANRYTPPGPDIAAELAALRAEIRRAHEAIQEMRDLHRLMVATSETVNREWVLHQKLYADRVKDVIQQGVEHTLETATAEIRTGIAGTRDAIDAGIKQHLQKWLDGLVKALGEYNIPIVAPPDMDWLGIAPGRIFSLTPVSDEVATVLNTELERRRADGGPG